MLFPGHGAGHLARYRVVMADPPWRYANFGQAKHGAARSHYSTVALEDLERMPVGDLAAENAVCLLWATQTVSAEGGHARLLRAWGFRPVTLAFWWRKTYRDGSPYCGLGFYTRSGGESCWLGVRGGGLTPDVHDVRQEIEGPVGRHSEKPPAVYERVERLWPEGDRLELFARAPRPGWTSWGNEVEGAPDLFPGWSPTADRERA